MHCKNYPHLLFFSHEDGSLTAWTRYYSCKRVLIPVFDVSFRKHLPAVASYAFEMICSIELVNIGLQSKKADLAVSSITHGPFLDDELKLFAVRSDGVIWSITYTGSTDPIASDEVLFSFILIMRNNLT